MERLRVWVIVPSLALVIGFGCGQKPEEAPKGPIRIGASVSLTGRFAEIGNPFHQGYLLWAKQLNAKGELLGRPVQLLIYDDKSDPQTSVYKYQQLILEDKVDLVLGPVNSPIAIVTSTVTEKLRYPMIVQAAKVGSLDREKIRDALASLDMVTVFGRYKVDQDGLPIGHEVFLIQWQKGKKEIVWPERYATAKLVYPIPSWNARR